MLRISVPFSLSHYLPPSTCLFLFTSHPTFLLPLIPDITECRSENKKTSRASGTKVHIHIINPICQEKRLKEEKKNKPTRFLCSFCVSPATYPLLPFFSPNYFSRRARGDDLKCLELIYSECDLFFTPEGRDIIIIHL